VGLFDKILNLASYSPSTGWADNAVMGSPWSTGTGMQSIIFPGTENPQVTTAMALTVPPVVRAIALYSTVAAKLTLKADAGATPVWMNQTFDAITPGKRLAGIVQDLIFHGDACLIVDRDGDGIRDGLLMPRDVWQTDAFGRIMVSGEVVEDQSQFIYIDSLLPQGFLEYAAEAVHEYRSLRRTINDRADNPIPLIDLHVTEHFEGTADELIAAQKDWNTARRAPGGATAITPLGIEAKPMSVGNADDELLISAQNNIRLTMANFLNINAAMLDGNNGTSDTYSNTLQNKNEFESLSMATWLTPIEQRFSQPDVVPIGTRIRFGPFDTAPAAPDAAGNAGSAVETTTQEVNA
jgi:hypothetical protein